jgi:hypothetical protein
VYQTAGQTIGKNGLGGVDQFKKMFLGVLDETVQKIEIDWLSPVKEAGLENVQIEIF